MAPTLGWRPNDRRWLVDDQVRRDEAIKRLKAKREFWSHLVAYLVVNAMLVGIWAVTGRGYFWPVWPLLGWGVGLILHAWETFFRRPISEEEIRREMDRGGI
jgi:hypothetical protein